MFFVIPGSVWFSSEMKALSDDCERFISFPPGHLYSSKTGSIVLLHLCKIDDLMRHYTRNTFAYSEGENSTSICCKYPSVLPTNLFPNI
jgi:asparagine synthetase B (glutamine-hydrolysing)